MSSNLILALQQAREFQQVIQQLHLSSDATAQQVLAFSEAYAKLDKAVTDLLTKVGPIDADAPCPVCYRQQEHAESCQLHRLEVAWAECAEGLRVRG